MARSFQSAATDNIHNGSFVFNASSGTVAIWAMPSWNSGDSVQRYLWSSETSVDAPSFQRYLDNNIYVGFNSPGRVTIADTGLFTSGTWAHWAYTYNSGGQAIYKDGVSKGTASGANPYSTGTGVFVGNRESPGSLNSFYGSLADFAVWNVVLSAGELSALAAGIRPNTIRPASLLGYWPLDGIQSTEPDLSGNAENGTLTGTAKADGPPIAMFTPRWPLNSQVVTAPSFVAAWAQGSNLPVIGTGLY